VPGAVDAKTTVCLTPPRNMLSCKSRLEHLLTCEKFPPLQAPESCNLSGVLEQVKKANANQASD
jgi:hypothetical protein